MTDRMRFVGPRDLVLYLRSLPALAGLPAAELAVVAQNTRERLYSRGSYLLREGRRVESFYLVVEGREYGVAGPQERVGLLSFLAREETGIDAIAETDVLALEFDADLISNLFEDNFSILLRDLRGTCSQLLEVLRKLPGDLGLPAPAPEGLKCPLRPLDLVERMVLLRQVEHFQKSSLDALAELARQLEEVRFDQGAQLWRQGDRADFLYMVVCGEVECVGDGGRQRFRVGAGFPMGALEALCGRPRWYDATTQTPVVTLRGEVDAFFDILEDHFEVAMDFMAAMAKALIELLGEGRTTALHVSLPGARSRMSVGQGATAQAGAAAPESAAVGRAPGSGDGRGYA
jgi:CRP-like cAMP-binding protein